MSLRPLAKSIQELSITFDLLGLDYPRLTIDVDSYSKLLTELGLKGLQSLYGIEIEVV